MNKVFKLFPLFAFIALMAFSVDTNAQKIAYVDAEKIIPEMPAYKKAKSEVEAYGKQLQKIIEGKQTEGQQYLQEVTGKAQRGELTPKQEQEAQVKLQEMQANLQKEAMEAEQKLAKKESDLLKPLYEEFNAALKKVATANEYGYILDKKLLLYSDGGIDATAKVKSALGITF